jgi:sugar phosphate isomerase/epimerase
MRRVVAKPFNQRDYDLFLSHAHADQAFVEQLYAWLTRSAGLKVFYDPSTGTVGAGISTMLQREIENCRGLLLVVSDASVESSWVEDEYNIAKDEASEHPDFRIVPVRLGQAAGKKLIKGVSWFDIPDGTFSGPAAQAILRGLYWRPNLPNPAASRDVYVSASWQVDGLSALAVGRYLIDKGFRLIGDMKDQPNFDLDRIRRIVETCGAFVSVVPFRDQAEANATQRPYKYFLQEIDVAESMDLSRLVIADPQIRRADRDDSAWLRMPTTASSVPPDVARRIDLLWEEREGAQIGNHVFLALSQEMEQAPATAAIRDTIEVVTGMNTVIGAEIRGQEQASEIQQNVQTAALVIADITGDNVNVCIEAGMARIAGRPYELISKGETRSGPFMIRGPNIAFYNNDLELYGAVHRVARAHRRRIINAELPRA